MNGTTLYNVEQSGQEISSFYIEQMHSKAYSQGVVPQDLRNTTLHKHQEL